MEGTPNGKTADEQEAAIKARGLKVAWKKVIRAALLGGPQISLAEIGAFDEMIEKADQSES